MNICDYIDNDTESFNGLIQYAGSPCKTFLEEVAHINAAFSHCKRNLPKEKKKLTDKSDMALHQFSIAALGTMMGQFELYQRFTFSTAFELTRYVNNFDIERCIRVLQKDHGLALDLVHLSAYRGQPAPIGQLIADNLNGWHIPTKVNRYLNAICNNLNFFSNEDAKILCALWQLRHTMVHTGGWLTLPDSQKVPELWTFGDKAIFLKHGFIEALARLFHNIAPLATSRLNKALSESLSNEVLNSTEFKNFSKISSPKKSWLPELH